MRAPVARLGLWLAGLIVAVPLQAVLFFSTGDADHNTSAPTGPLADSGWQFEGRWGAYLGTVISSNVFLTAQHVGGNPGAPFILDGIAYPTTAFFDDPETDLRLVRVCGSFLAAATLHTNTNEPGMPVVVYGRGTQRGAPVTTGSLDANTNGWHWGISDYRLRWGENVVETVVNGTNDFGAGIGDLLKMTFSTDGGPNECHLSVGDSAGGLFILDGTWQLAGINYAVDGPYRTTAEGPGFDAAIFDAGGLFQADDNGGWTLTPVLPFDQPGAFYATRVSARIEWIRGVLQQIMVQGDPPVLQSSSDMAGPFADRLDAEIDPDNKWVTFPQPMGSQFYRLRGCRTFRITGIDLLPGALRIEYETAVD